MGIRMLHRTAVAKDLGIKPSLYGFNVTQVAFRSYNTLQQVLDSIGSMYSDIQNDSIGFYLGIEIQGDQIWDNVNPPTPLNNRLTRET